MIDYKLKIKCLMFKLGLRQTIPALFINQIEIRENNEELINIRNEKEFVFSDRFSHKDPIYLRKSVAQKLKDATSSLPKGTMFKIYSAYRSLEAQKQIWKNRFETNQKKFPDLALQEIEKITRGQVADPHRGFGGHQTGGAIDITLCRCDGQELDMGTKISEHNCKTKTNAHNLTAEQKNNRKILKDVLEKQGFINYPAEWWHFSYGDRMWAAYTKKNLCFYGLADEVDKID